MVGQLNGRIEAGASMDGRLDHNGTVSGTIALFSGSGVTDWRHLQGKPFASIGQNLRVDGGILSVDTAPNIEQDNTRPVTSAAVFTEVGNIDALLAAI